MKRTSFIIVGVFVLLFGALGLYVSGYMPGSIRRDANGFMHGTGRWLYHYDSGPVMLEEHYLAGRLRFSRWFRPDGRVVDETRWQHGDGVGYYLRQDGTVRTKMEYRGERAHGQATYYKEDGVTIDHLAEYRDGQKIETSK
jgi:antitoxin component YwqK of YwqJK toxin-antitoxin module